MSLLIAAIVQAVTSQPPEKIDLTIPQPCDARKSSDDEIVVCARRSEGVSPYGIGEPSPGRAGPPKAQIQFADGVTASAETESADVGGF